MNTHFSRVFVAVLLSSISVESAQSRRPMVVEDLFNLQTMGDVRISPDGQSIAVVIQRAWNDPETFRPYDLFGNDHADIWILPSAGGPPRNITRGARQGSGYWNPVWSPDGQRLALLSTAGRDNVRVYVWDKNSGRLQQLADRGVDLRAGTDATGSGDWNPVQWVDDRRLLVTALPEGEQPQEFRLRRQTQRIAYEAWTKAAGGRDSTASVLDGGAPPTQPERPAQLLLIDVVTKRARMLAEGAIKHILLSPDREHVAIIAQMPPPTSSAGKPRVAASPALSRLGIVSLRRGASVRWLEGVFNPAIGFGTHPHRWSPRGKALAVIASERAESASTGAVFVISPTAFSAHRVAENLTASALVWTAGDQLLIRARTPGQQERSDWWCLPSGSGEARNITASFTAVPAQLARTAQSNEMIGVADGALLKFDLTDASVRNLSETAAARISLVWPDAEERATSPVTSVIVRESGGNSLFRLDLSSSSAPVSKFPQPAGSTAVAGYHSGRNLAVFTAPRDPDGTFIWTGRGGTSDFTRRITLNAQLSGIAGAERQLIDYRTADGRDLKAVLLLPVGYQKGTRYPLVTWVYPGFTIRDIVNDFWVNKNQAHPDNLHILAGHGYAVLIPSMPITDNSRTLRELPLGVLPAVDRVIELGIADPNRVAVMGQSAGGFATYGLITQTNRFKAAVAISGFANNISLYGTFSGQARYRDDVDEILTGVPQGRLGVPPWEDPNRYVENSPITFINRVETPLLIVHGDIDFVPIQQAEEVFTSLTRLGKRVRFVRYWGESHGATDGAANMRDRWRQILGWLDTYVREGQ